MKKIVCYFTLTCFCFSFPGISMFSTLLARETIHSRQNFLTQLPNRRLPKLAPLKHPVKTIETPIVSGEVVITPTIEALARQLNHNLDEIFQYVHSFDYETYYGYLKGPVETIVDQAGNDYDLSTLLVSLLTVSKIPAKFVNGNITLGIEEFMNWIGAKTPEAALSVFQKNGIPSEAIYENEKISHIKFRFVWVEAFAPQESPFFPPGIYPPSPVVYPQRYHPLPVRFGWQRLNPAYKQYAYTEGIELTPDTEENLATLIESAITFQSDKIFTVDRKQLSNYLDEQVILLNGLTIAEILGSRKIKKSRNVCRYEQNSYGIPDKKFMAKITLPGGIEHIAPMPEIAGKRVSVVHIAPAGDTLQTIPVLQIDGKTVITGTDIEFGQTSNRIQVGFLDPGTAAGWEYTTKELTIGTRANLCIATQKTSLAELRRLNAKLKAATRDLPEDTIMTGDMIDESLRLSGLLFYGLVDLFSSYASRTFNVIPVDHVSMAYVVSDVHLLSMFGFITGTQKAGVYIDGIRGVKCITSATENTKNETAWMKAYGNIGSNMEHAMIELLYDVTAVSTGKIFSLASQKGVPFHVLNDIDTLETDLEQISAHENVKNNIRAHVIAGYKATIPAYGVSINDWAGEGWIIENEETGANAHMIYGGLQGNKRMTHGGSSTVPIGELIAVLFHMMYKAEDISVVPGSILFAASMHFVAAHLLLAAGGSAFILAIWYGAIGCLLFGVAAGVLIALSRTPQTRRKYAY